MRTPTFLLLLLISILWESEAVYGRGSLSTWPHANNPNQAAQADACTLDVVLVTFDDETTANPMTPESCGSATNPQRCDYHEHDRPYGTNPGQDVRNRYTLRDFERLFNGGYEPLQDLPFVGDTVTVGNRRTNRDTLPEVFGSVRAYYNSMSLDPKDQAKGITKGKFQLHVRLVNPDDGNGYPRWIELPQTKATYAGKKADDADPTFWDDAYNAAWKEIQCWNPDVVDPAGCGASDLSGYDKDIKDLPNSDSADFPWQRLVRRKVVYLYSGATFTDENTTTLLHPQADETTKANPSKKSDVGYRYVMGEREGWGKNNHAIDEFAGIGIHVHEIGHLLGLEHGQGEWSPDDSEGSSTPSETHKGANFVGWGLMQGGREGPERKDTTRGLSQAYSSCPVPINPFYRMDLGWLKPTEITESKEDYALALGSVHLIDTGTRFHPTDSSIAHDILLLERRSHNSFGRYISFYEFENQDPGLLIWRRRGRSEKEKSAAERPILIVADGRRIRNAQKGNPTVKEYQDQLSDPFPGSAAVNAVYATTGGEGLRQQTTGTYDHIDPGNLGVALTDIRRDDDALTLDVQLNYWAGDIEQPGKEVTRMKETWGDGVPSWDTGTVSVAGDLTIKGNRKARLTIARGTKVHFLANTDATGGGRDRTRSELIVEGELTVEEASGTSDGGVPFRSADDTPSNADWYGIRVVGAGNVTLSDAKVQDGSRCVQEEEEEDKSLTLTMTNATLTNCGTTVTLHPIIPYPYVGQEAIQTTLTPADGLTATDVEWQWQRRRRLTDGWTDIASATLATYTPTTDDVGSQLRATVRYQAETNVYPRAQSAATSPVAGVPGVPLNLVAAAGDKSVTLTWEAPTSHGGAAITGYAYRYRPDGGTRWLPSAAGRIVKETTFYVQRTLDGLTNGRPYTFEVWAVNEVGAGASAFQRATPQAAGSIVVSFGSDSYRAFEGGAPALVMVQLSPSPSRSVSIPVVVSADEGTEPGDYTVAGLNEGKVVFAAGESVSSFTITANEDADSDNETVSVSFRTSGVASATPKATVTLLDNDEADGTVALSSLSPQEGVQLTAEWTGPSGITNPRWQWQRQSGPTSWTNVAGVSSQPQPWVSIYIPQAGDVGYPLRATVRYTDGGGSNQRAESATTAAVRAATVEPEGPPLFSSDRVSYSVPAGSTDQQILPAAERAESYATVGTLPGYVAVNTTTRAITIRPENTHVGDAEFIWRARNPRGTDDLTVNITVTPLVETEYAYRAAQTAPLFDASASQTPDHWSSGAITWTDAAPRVWRIGRTRPAGGSWSGWGPLKKYSERPAAAATFYQRARRAPATPATQTAPTLATPSGWQTTPPAATDTQGVWTTTANRAQGAIPWLFTAPTQQTPPKIVQLPEPPRHFTAAIGSPLTPGSIDLAWDSPTSGGTPTGYRVEYRFASGSWLLGATPTLTNASLVLSRAGALYQFRVRAENSAGSSGWVEATGTTSKPVPTETETAYRLHTSGTTAPSFTATASGVPSGWSSSRPTPNPHARYEWEISRTRPTGGAWSSWGSATVVSTYTERRTAYRLHTSGTTAPSFTASASDVPSGWSSSRQTPNPHERYEWEISRTRPAGGAWSSWGSASVVARYTERQTAYRLHTSGTTAPSFTASASDVPSGWSSSRQTPNPHARYEWEISRTRPAGGAWSSWGSASVVSRYTERQTAYKRNDSSTTAPAFSSTASGTPYGWSSSQPSPTSSNRYVWQISRTRPTGGSWSRWGSASVVARYTEQQTAYKRNNSSTTAPAFSSTASGTPYGWSSSPPSPTSSNRYVWRISRTRPAGGSWSSWGSASVVARYTERQTAYKRNNSSTTAPAFSSTASGTPYGWSSSPPSPTSSNRYVWQISRSRPAGGSWSSWGSASVVARYTERQTAYKRNNSSTTAPAFSSTASGTPYGWSSSPPSPTSSNRYVWRISRTRPAGGSWSSWGSATVVSTYTERQTAFRLHTSGTTAPSFSASASGVPSGWSSSRPTPNPHARYEWQIRRTRPTGGSWSRWGSATVVSTYTERQTAFRLHTSGTTAPSFSASASGVPSGWSSSRRTPNPHARYEWQIRRTRPTGGSWSNWGSATVVSTYTARQTTYRRNTSGTTVPAATSGTDSESPTIKVQRRLVMTPGGPSSLAAASSFVIGPMAGRIGIPARRPKSASGPESLNPAG